MNVINEAFMIAIKKFVKKIPLTKEEQNVIDFMKKIGEDGLKLAQGSVFWDKAKNYNLNDSLDSEEIREKRFKQLIENALIVLEQNKKKS